MTLLLTPTAPVKYVQSRYMQPTPTRSAEKKRDVKRYVGPHEY